MFPAVFMLFHLYNHVPTNKEHCNSFQQKNYAYFAPVFLVSCDDACKDRCYV